MEVSLAVDTRADTYNQNREERLQGDKQVTRVAKPEEHSNSILKREENENENGKRKKCLINTSMLIKVNTRIPEKKS